MNNRVTLFAAADMNYFYKHGFAFAKSAVDAGNFVHLIIWHDSPEDTRGDKQKEFFRFMSKFFEHIPKELCTVQLLSHNTIMAFRKSLKIIEDRAFYACIRFLMLEDVVKKEYEWNDRAVMVFDIDSIVRKKIEVSDEYEIGLFLRENENLAGTPYEIAGMKVAAGALYVTIEALDFINLIRENIAKNEVRWFCDQLAIHDAYRVLKPVYKIWEMDKNFLDWEFNEDSVCWTGKGPRKYENEKYLAAKKEVEEIGLL